MTNINQSDNANETVWYTPKSLAAHLQVSVDRSGKAYPSATPSYAPYSGSESPTRYEVRVKKSAVAVTARKGGQLTELRPFVPTSQYIVPVGVTTMPSMLYLRTEGLDPNAVVLP